MGCLPGQEGGGAKGTVAEARGGGKGNPGAGAKRKTQSHLFKMGVNFKCKQPGGGEGAGPQAPGPARQPGQLSGREVRPEGRRRRREAGVGGRGGESL